MYFQFSRPPPSKPSTPIIHVHVSVTLCIYPTTPHRPPLMNNGATEHQVTQEEKAQAF